ncbi:MAG: DUF115 domain-containing protein [Desulfovibrionaceae bacterium]|nr:DUF115 domain-containing protein [Desulfovibrionaceae bacterium]MBF0515064.1 DUF115 domain-containing protein [Desulfovibrionaceae bacterium]
MTGPASAAARIEALRTLGQLEQAASDAPLHRERPRSGRHVLSEHEPIWRFCHPKFAVDARYFPDGKPLFGFPKPGDSLDEILASTGWVVVVGAVDSELLNRILARPDVVCLVFEPSLRHFAEFIVSFDFHKRASKPFFFVGDHHGFAAPLMDMLPKAIVERGHPVFFVEDQPGGEDAYQRELIEKIEFFYYRHRIYQFEGHWGRSGLPSRDIRRGLFYDQQVHLYQNAVDYLTQGTINDLAGAFAGETAIVATAGPDLDSKIDYIRANRDKAVVICVNSALRTLAAAGVTPHFVVINDTSLESAATIENLSLPPGVRLVAHAAAGTGRGAFADIFFFGNVLPELFPVIPMLRLHGSVASTAFSLADHLGCARVVFVGLHMAGRDPFSMSYTKQSLQAEGFAQRDKPLTGEYPQFYPARAADGSTMYTTLNFFDAAQWLLDEIARSGIKVVNTTSDTIVHGRGVVIDPDFAVPARGDIEALAAKITPVPQKADRAKIHEYLLGQIEFWRLVKKMAAEDISLKEHPMFLEHFQRHLDAWDGANVSFLLERFPGFDFLTGVYVGYFGAFGPEAKRQAALTYLGGCLEMAGTFVKILTEQLRRLLALGSGPGAPAGRQARP